MSVDFFWARGARAGTLNSAWFLPALVVAAVAACSAPAERELAQRGFDIIGGLPAPSPELDHTGALVYRIRATGDVGVLCSATLIGPETVVTANHCVAPLVAFERVGIDVSWARGANALEPEEQIPIVAFTRSPLPQGGAFGYGADVAVIHLERPVAVTPAVVRPFSSALLGTSMVTLGYGVSSAAALGDGRRRIGRETLVATEGRIYEAMFGDFESFVEWKLTGATSDADALQALALDPTLGDLAALTREYDDFRLLEGYEVVTGKGAGDTQSCEGDSGSPLALVAADGAFETYGVVSGGVDSARSACDFGQVFATFGPAVYQMLEQERGWTDPCGELDARGVCEGSVARRCQTSFASALRGPSEQDCALLEQDCVTTDAGAACAAAVPEAGSPLATP